MKKNKSSYSPPIICAHRGASGYAPENTLAAFKKALELRTDMVELDVQQISDNKLYIMHDTEIDRTTNGTGSLSKLTSPEVEKLDAGSWFSEKFQGEPVPQFEAVLSLVKGKAALNIELKCNGSRDNLIQSVIEKIREFGVEKECVLTSFDFAIIDEVRRQAPDLSVGYIFNARGFLPHVFRANVEVLSIHFALANTIFVKLAKKFGKKVFVWTANKDWLMRRMCRLGVDGIITDYPDKLAKVIETFMHKMN